MRLLRSNRELGSLLPREEKQHRPVQLLRLCPLEEKMIIILNQ